MSANGAKVHFCIGCDYPIAVYGRLWPCLHAYCLQCATDMTQCKLCCNPIDRIERVPYQQGLFISPATLQGLKTREDLQKHAREVQAQLESSQPAATATPPQQPGYR